MSKMTPVFPYDMFMLLTPNLLIVKTIPTDQYESFQHVFPLLTCMLEKFVGGHLTSNYSK